MYWSICGCRYLQPKWVDSSRVYTGAQSARFAFSRLFRALLDRSERRRAGLAAGPALDASVTRERYCFAETEMLVMSMMPISKSSAVSVTPFTYGFKRYFVAE